MTSSTTMVSGRLRVGGRPAAGQDVLLFGEESRNLEAAATTDAEGAFRLARPRAPGALVVLAALRGEVCTAVAAPVPDGPAGALDLDVPDEGLRQVRGLVEGDDALPLTVRVDLVRVEGLPDWLAERATLRGPGVAASSFAELPVDDGRFRLRVRPGRYRIRGDRVVYDQARIRGPRATSVIVDRARLGPTGTGLPGEQWGGFLVDVGADDVDLVLSVRRLEESEI